MGEDEEADGGVETAVVAGIGDPEDCRDEEEVREPPLSAPVENVGEGIEPVDEMVLLGDETVLLGVGPYVVGLTV